MSEFFSAERSYAFEPPVNVKSNIKVIGVGGGGSNAVTYMFNQGIVGVEFVVCNTDAQALQKSPVPNKLQIGNKVTGGLGAGSLPENGRQAAEESREEIRELLGDGTKMVFITAGMGGGTGTGAAPVIAEVARELGILTVGIVTLPFSFEGKYKMQRARDGVRDMKNYCDTVLEILNDKLKEFYGSLSISEAFSQADTILLRGSKAIAEIITKPGEINVDFMDVNTVMRGAGTAVMGSATVSGEKALMLAAKEALHSPLLNNREINGAQKILVAIEAAENAVSLDDLTEVVNYIQDMAGGEADLKYGFHKNPDLGDQVQITVIATGFRAPTSTDELTAQTGGFAAPAGQVLTSNPVSNPDRVVVDEFGRVVQQPSVPAPAPEPEQPSGNVRIRPEERFQAPAPKPNPVQDAIPQTRPVNPPPRPEPIQPPTPPTIKRPDNLQKMDINGQPLMPGMEPPADVVGPDLSDFDKADLRERLEREREARKAAVRPGASVLDSERLRKLEESPAYARSHYGIDERPSVSPAELSRYTLNEDRDILGNNQFLHDNVD